MTGPARTPDEAAAAWHADLSASAAVDEVRDGRFARATIKVVVTAMIAGLIWAALTPVHEITTGAGVIATASDVERIEHPEGGVVVDLAQRRGDRVAPGQTVLRLDDSGLRRERTALLAQLETLEAEAGRVAYVLAPEGATPPPTDDTAGASETAFWAEQEFLAAQLDVLRAERLNLETSVAVLDDRGDNLSEETQILRTQLDRYTQLSADGVVRLNDREALQRELLRSERDALALVGERQRLIAALAENRMREVELRAARRREAALRQAELEAQLTALRQSLAELDERIGRTAVAAGTGGIILDLAVTNVGEVVGPGDLIAEIVPEDSAMVAEVEVPADRIGSVTPGMEARVKVASFDFTRFGILRSRVADISPTSFLNDAGVAVYRVRLDLPNGGEAPELGGRRIRPGMTVSADILSDQKSVLAYLLKPLRVLSDRAFTES